MKIDDMPLRLASTAKTPTGSTFRVNISAPAVHFALSSGTPTRYVKTAESCSKSRHSFWAIAACPFYACAVDNPQKLLAAGGDDHAALALLAAAGSLAAFCVG